MTQQQHPRGRLPGQQLSENHALLETPVKVMK
jgi:hypothetical protein